jgi:hypothetical protein
MMELVHVTVMVQDIVWDEFLISQDGILFITFNSQHSNNDVAHLEPIESTEANKLTISQHEGSTQIKCNINNIQHVNGENITEKVNKLESSSHEKGDNNTLQEEEFRIPKCVQKLYISGYLLSLFVRTLQLSAVYRRSVVTNFKKCSKRTGTISHPSSIVKVNMKLVCPRSHIIDFAWYV